MVWLLAGVAIGAVTAAAALVLIVRALDREIVRMFDPWH